MKFLSILYYAGPIAALVSEDALLYKRDKKFIGYRMTNPVEMARIQANNMRMVMSDGQRGRQLGDGASLTPGFQQYKVVNPKDGTPWDCAVFLDASIWDGVPKAWIPRAYEFPEDVEKNPEACNWSRLWSPRFSYNRNRFLRLLNPSWNLSMLVPFAVIDGFEDILQALLPPDLIKQGNIEMECGERGTDANERISRFGTIDWHVSTLLGYGMGSDVKQAAYKN